MSIRLGNGTLIAGGAQTFPLLSTMWADHILNDVSWLRADTFSWQSGDVYKSVYDKLVAEYATGTTETEGAITFKRTESGFKIAEETQEQAILDLYNSTGVAWYYILDTTNRRFKLPRTKYNFTGLRDSVGSYVAESLPNGTYSSAMYNESGATANHIADGGGTVGASLSIKLSDFNSVFKDNAPVQQRATQMYLYFFVGNYVQNQTAIDIGAMSEQLNGKADRDLNNTTRPYIVETYDDGDGNGYRVWSNKFCEQYGFIQSDGGANWRYQNFQKEYANKNYIITTSNVQLVDGQAGAGDLIINKNNSTTTSFCWFWNANTYYGMYWKAEGYIL